MSDDNKNFNDDLNEMLDDAKDTAKRAGEKISSSAKEFSEEAKEFGRNAKGQANKFANDTKTVLGNGKNIAIIAHITLIGWIIALVMNNNEKSELGSFYIRQVLGIMLLGLVCSIIPIINLIAWIIPLAMWVMSLIGSLSGEKKPVFLLGDQFQDWFKSL
ncbi:MAG: YtxH domain-containing protein [Psychroserpens sp.]|uniref:YtxH domain-containing protein n=1 Tax=Psychroserpens sp. TaxID=2020870 RepID=UPI003CC37628